MSLLRFPRQHAPRHIKRARQCRTKCEEKSAINKGVGCEWDEASQTCGLTKECDLKLQRKTDVGTIWGAVCEQVTKMEKKKSWTKMLKKSADTF